MATKLHKSIMRRVYYLYAIKLATDPVLIYGFTMLAMLIVLTHFVSIDHVAYNFVHQPFSNLGTFIVHAAMHTEIWTLLVIGLMVLGTLSIRWQFRSPAALHTEVHA